MRWGLIPHWAKDLKKIPLLNNARAETVASKPIFKNAFRRQRCIIPANGFYEWKLLMDGKHKQPYYISSNDGCPTPFVGIWESTPINNTTIDSCSIITTECNDLMRPIHDRMPVILFPVSFDTWLKPTELSSKVLKFLVKPFDPERMLAWPVSIEVNKSINQGEQLIHPVQVAT